MNEIKEIIKKLIEWIGIGGIVIVLSFTIAGWLYYDLSTSHEQLNAQEVSGLFLLSLLVVSLVRLLTKLIFHERK